MAISPKTVIPTTFKGMNAYHRQLHSQFARTVSVLSSRFDAIKREMKKMATPNFSFRIK